MEEQFFVQKLDRLYTWVGQRLSACPIRDGVTFYHRKEKIFKAVKQKAGWHLQFNVPVPECAGLVKLSPEEARRRKLGRALWIYRGDSDHDARLLVQAALDSLPQRWLVEPAMERDTATVCGGTCPCFKKMERLAALTSIPEDLRNLLQNAYDLLLNGQYVAFVEQMRLGIDKAAGFLLREQGEEPSGGVQAKIEALIRLGAIPKSLETEGEVLFSRRWNEEAQIVQERAYPVALMMISFLKKLLKS